MTNDIQTNYSTYKLIETEDGTHTLYSSMHDENCHSLAGAKLETYHNYFEANGLDEHFQNYTSTDPELSILEVGFGLGMGLTCLLERLSLTKFSGVCYFTTLEIDPELVIWALDKITSQNSCYKFTKKENHSSNIYYQITSNNFELHFQAIIGDARSTLPKHLENLPKFDYIFQDPFSPKKNPTLWTKQWFNCLLQQSRDSVKLSTYCASSAVRKTLMSTGWKITNKKGLKNKKSITLATKLQDNEKQDEQFMGILNSSKVAILAD